MKGIFIFHFLLVWLSFRAQNTANFNIPDTVCVNQTFTIQNTSTGAPSTYYWSFCQGNTNVTPNAVNLGNIGLFNGPVYYTIGKDGSNYYAFVSNNWGGTVSRLFYGSSLLNTPVATNLGNFGGAITTSIEDMHLEKQGGNWYGIMVGCTGGGGRIVRLNFGSSLANTPTATNMGNIGGLNYPQKLQIFSSGGNYYGFTPNAFGNTITRFNFGSSLANTPTGVNLGNVGVLSQPDDIAIINYGGNWYGYIVNEISNTLTRLDFGNSLLNTPTGTNLGNTGALNGPRGIDVYVECGEIRGLITNRYGNDLLKMNFTSGPAGPIITTSYGNIANFSFPHSIERFRVGDTLFAMIPNVSNHTLSRIYYPGCNNSSLSSSTLSTPPAISYNQPGQYYISLTVDETLITQSSYCKLITVLASPSISVNTSTICLGQQTATLIANGANSYSWNPSVGLSSQSGNSVTANPVASQNYTVTGVNLNGCVGTSTTNVKVNQLPNISSNGINCSGVSTASLLAFGANSYSWNPNAGLSSATGSLVTLSPTSTVYTITGVDLNGCVNSNTTTITYIASPTVNVNNSTICLGQQSATLTASGASTYSWSPAISLSSSSGSMVVANPNSSTNYTVVGFTNGCSNDAIAIVSVPPLPTITVNSSTICLGQQTATLLASGANSYSWNPSTGLSSTLGNSVTANPVTSQNYTVTGVDLNGCVGTSTTNVKVNQLPNISSNGINCSGVSTASLLAFGANSYSWNPNAGLSSPTGSLVTLSPTSTVYTITGTDTNGCINTNTVTISNLPTPTVTVNSATICLSQQTATLIANGADVYSWSPSISLSSTTGSLVLANPTLSQVYTLTGTNSSGCTNTATLNVFVNNIPNISVNSSSICLGQQTATLVANGANSYTWSPLIGLSSSIGNSVTANPNTTQNYTVSGMDLNGCIGQAFTSVQVHSLPVIVSNGVSCVSAQIATLVAQGASSYSWAPSAGLSSSTGSLVTLTPTSNITYTITGTDLNGCINTTTTGVSAGNTPTLTINNASICLGQQTATLIAYGANTYSWSPSIWLSSTTNSIVTLSPISSQIYTVTGVDISGCASTTTVSVNVFDLPYVNAGQDTTINFGDSINLTGIGNGQLAWISGNNLNCNHCSSTYVFPEENSCYMLEVTSENGCKNKDYLCINVDKDFGIYIPNCFTPNGDGLNDIFNVVCFGIKDIELLIFDRWGEQIFDSNSALKGWDGSYKGKMCQNGVYTFVLKYTTIKNFYSEKYGHVSLLGNNR